MRYVFDIETDGLLESVSELHSLVLYNIDTDEIFSCADDRRFLSLQKGLRMLADADVLIGHNIKLYDIPVLKKLHKMEFEAEIFDTLTASRLIWPDMLERDLKLHSIPKPLYGRHSLAAWGERLKFPKGDFGAAADCWKQWTLPLQKYCENDVLLNVKLYKTIEAKNYSKMALDLEMEFQDIIVQQERNGVCFDKPAAMKMYYQLKKDSDKFKADLQEKVGPIVKETIFIPKRDNQTKGYKKDVPFTKRSSTPFNPGSRVQIADYLIKTHGWQPKEFTPSGRPKCSADIIGKLPYEEAGIISKYLTANKLLGMLGEGDKAWLRLVKDNKLYCHVITNGTVSGRTSTNSPNLAQVPAPGKYMGEACRKLFTASPGMVMVGADAKALELRCFGHFLAKYDCGDYIQKLLESDIHEANREAAGLPDRPTAKRYMFAFLYGAGDDLLGSIIDPKATNEIQKRLGTRARVLLYRKMPAIEKLIRDVQHVARTRGHLIGIDGRILPVREAYRALNLLLQSSGAILVKRATVIFWNKVKARGLAVRQLLHIYDEIDVECTPEIAEEVGELLLESFVESGEEFNFKCPIEGNYKIGKNWYEIH